MVKRRSSSWLLVAMAVLVATVASHHGPLQAQDEAVVRKVIELGKSDNRVMTWNDYASNRFGGRETGSHAYNDAAEWAVWQFRQWGLEAELDEAGEVPVGFNRGPWFGKMVKPVEKSLFFGTPSFTAGTKGVERGPVAILKADPFSIPGRNPTQEQREQKRAAVAAAVAEVQANKDRFKGRWVLIGGESTGFARDGRRSTQEYSDAQLMPPLTDALVEAGALGTIQMSKAEPFRILDGHVDSWDKLPVLPDIKLVETDYDEVKALVEKGQPVELEFDIRNWFKMGPVKYHNVVATIRGSQYPDEYVVLGGHFDCFSGATGAVDNGSGFAVGMEAIRLLQAAGAKPKRSVMMILFAAEEIGLVGSQEWLKKRQHVHDKIPVMINRDGSPSAIVGATVPAGWYADFEQIARPLENLNPRWPFRLQRNDYPSTPPERPGGTDSSSFAMLRIPTLSFRTETDYVYTRAWHTLYDTYNELVPYIEHQQHSALVTAVVAYGIANLDKPLTRAGVYLQDGLYADIVFGSGDSQKRIMASLDFENAPLQTANFVRIAEGRDPQARAAAMPAGMGQRQPEVPPIGRVAGVAGGTANAIVASDAQKSVAIANLPRARNTAIRHDAAGILGASGPNMFYLTLRANPGLDNRHTAIGKVIAGGALLGELKKDDPIRSIRIIRVGQPARDFKTDDEAFRQLMEKARGKKTTTE
jgi:carboxypeptidase Q